MVDYNKYVELAIPYKLKGRALNGIDCWGLIWLFYKEQMGIDLPSYHDISKEELDEYALGRVFLKEKAHNWMRVDSPRNGDVVLCRDKLRPLHVGIYKEHGKMLHIREGETPNISKLDNFEWKHKVLGIYRLKELQST